MDKEEVWTSGRNTKDMYEITEKGEELLKRLQKQGQDLPTSRIENIKRA